MAITLRPTRSSALSRAHPDVLQARWRIYAAAGKRVYMAYDSETAALLTIIVGSIPLYEFDDNDIATETAITSAVGTKHLARADCRVLGLYGTGRQARRHPDEEAPLGPGQQEAHLALRRFHMSLSEGRSIAANRATSTHVGIEITMPSQASST